MALTMLRKDAGGAADDEEDCTVYAVAGLATRVSSAYHSKTTVHFLVHRESYRLIELLVAVPKHPFRQTVGLQNFWKLGTLGADGGSSKALNATKVINGRPISVLA